MGGDFFEGKSETEQIREFTPEALSALQREVPLFLQISPLLQGLQLGALNTETGTPAQGTRSAAATVQPSVEATGTAAGLGAGTLSNILANLSPEDPAFNDILRGLSQSVSTTVPAIVDPRFAVGLRPSVSTRGTATPSPFQVVQGFASLTGTGAAAACWIALRLYGPLDIRFHLARHWVNTGLSRTMLGRLAMQAYGRLGAKLPRSKLLCRLMKSLFDTAWKRALKEMTDG